MSPRVAVLDDAPSLLLLYKVILGPRGFDVVIFGEEQTNPAAIAAMQPDLIIVCGAYPMAKYDLPLLTGLRAQAVIASTPIIVSSAMPPVLLSPDPYAPFKPITVLMKPFSHQDLLNCVTRALCPQAASRH